MRSQKYSAMSQYITAGSFNTLCEGKQLHLSRTIQCCCGKHTVLLFICHLLALYWQGTCPVLNIGTAVLRITMLSIPHDWSAAILILFSLFSDTVLENMFLWKAYSINDLRQKFRIEEMNSNCFIRMIDFTFFQSIGGRIEKQKQQ